MLEKVYCVTPVLGVMTQINIRPSYTGQSWMADEGIAVEKEYTSQSHLLVPSKPP